MFSLNSQKQRSVILKAKAWSFPLLAGLFSFFCLAASLSVPTSALACSWEPEPELMYVSFWRSDLLAPKGRDFLAFNYADLVNHFPPSTVDEGSNITDWKALGNFTDADVKSFVYDSTPEQLQAFKKAMEAKNAYSGISGAIPKYIEGKNDIALLNYMIFAKNVSKIFPATQDSSDEDSWKYSKLPDKESLALAKTAESEMKEAKEPFLKLRYAYQAMRLYRARLEYPLCVKFFEEYVAPIDTTSEVKEWCRSFYAGSLYWTKEYPKAFFEFSKVFKSSSRYRSIAYIGARWTLRNQFAAPVRNDIIKRALGMAKTKEERSAVLVLACYMSNLLSQYGDTTAQELDDYLALLLRDINSGGADLPVDLPLLVSWKINSAEASMFSLEGIILHTFNYSMPILPTPQKDSDSYKSSLKSLAQVQPLLASLNDKFASPAFCLAAQSYMAFLQGNYDKAKKLLEAADKSAEEGNAPLKAQLQVLHMAYNASLLPLDETGEATIQKDYTDMLALIHALPPEPSNYEEKKKASFSQLSERSWLETSIIHIWSHILPARYVAEGKTAMEVLCLKRAGKLGAAGSFAPALAFRVMDGFNSKQVKDLQKLTISPQGELQKMLVADFNKAYPADFLSELEATINIREHNFAAAAQAMSAIPAGASNYRQTVTSSALTPHDEWPKRNPFKEPLAWGATYESNDNTYILVMDPLRAKDPVLPGIDSEIARLKKAVNSAADPAAKEAILQKIDLYSRAVEGFKSKHPDKYLFASTMAALKELSSEKGELGAKSMYAYAKGLINMSYVGNNRYLYTWWRGGGELYMYNFSKGEGSKYYKIITPEDYYINNSAKEAFLKAADMTTDPELKARALFMASFTLETSKTLYSDDTGNYLADYSSDKKLGSYFTDNPYLKQLKAEFSNTEFYRVAFKSCSYLRDFDKVK